MRRSEDLEKVETVGDSGRMTYWLAICPIRENIGGMFLCRQCDDNKIPCKKNNQKWQF